MNRRTLLAGVAAGLWGASARAQQACFDRMDCFDTQLPGPSLDLQFTAGALDPRITFTRADATSCATFFNVSGTLTTVAANVPRFDYDPVTHAPRGLLIEESRTNSVRNSTMVGTSPGTPGTLPTNWVPPGTGLIGLTQQIVGSGTVNGIPYIDIRLFGTTTGQFGGVCSFDATTQIAAVNGQTWTQSMYVALVGGSLSGVAAIGHKSVTYNAGAGVLSNAIIANISVTGTLTRVSVSGTLVDATTAFLCPGVYFNAVGASGAVIDFTLRIAAPQLELGAFKTSYIPTTAAAATRAADVATMPVGSWFNAAAGTLAVEAMQPVAAGKATTLAAFTGASGKTGMTVNASNQVAMFDTTGAINTSLGAEPIAATFKAGVAWQAGSQRGSLNGGAPVSAAAGTLTAGNTTLSLGYDGTSQQPCGTISRVRYWPRALGAGELQAVTQ